ncbi:hypothetical protein GPECTOR_860g102 [Gonium pectorale]|uniref:Uncharacterized protein n=1 Tax=Gonium pectorale TaxID=33097 RepID=A0A150FTY8_GONPE|nr:hypothetical protein GPECTOR_860g102 [Gonium pectorale]|eukprot:KXZ41069.1 hypothetical protein GPECTOR_860g102 [Gonium pectorale]
MAMLVSLLGLATNLVATPLLLLRAPPSRVRALKRFLKVAGGETSEALCMKVPIRGIASSEARELLHNLLDAKPDLPTFGSPVLKALITYKWRTFARVVLGFFLFDHLLYMALFT